MIGKQRKAAGNQAAFSKRDPYGKRKKKKASRNQREKRKMKQLGPVSKKTGFFFLFDVSFPFVTE
ncbi:MAG: hypothetical protein HYW57_03155 [Ignavibacteriales bacterium]|nr:hypothetical protein [Ignavibacteriales bacterium]